jgi:serine/threonine protein kinase
MNHTARSPVETSLPPPGSVVAGKYRIDGVIGQGGMGVVMSALDVSLGRQVAVKFLAPSKASREGAVPRFLREARAAASLQSEHVVRVFEVGTLPNESPYIVMELLRGSDLSAILASRRGLPIEEAVDYLLQACEALGEAHLRGIVHRDLKPQNLFVTQRPDGSPCLKILDFGISKAVDEAAPNLTATDTVMGTPLYMSPEQVRSLKNVDYRSDIWALGSILFELVCASPIFEAPSASALCAMIAMDPPIPLRARRPDAPAELEAIILRCLHKDPAGRFQDVAALADALVPFASDRGRQSALRVSRVVRSGGSNPAAMAMGVPLDMAPTTADPRMSSAPYPQSPYPAPAPAPYAPAPYGTPALGPSGFPGAQASSAFPPGTPPPNTQQTWQQPGGPTQTGALGAAPKKSGAIWAILGVLAAMLVIGLAAAGYFLLLGKRAADTQASVDAGAPVLASSASAPSSTPPSSTVPGMLAASAAPSAASSAHPVPAAPKHSSAKDAGAPVAPPPTAPPAKPTGPTKEELDAMKRQAADRCAFARQRLARNDASNSVAKQMKVEVCLKATSLSPNSGAAECDRSVCREICTVLKDSMCHMQLDQAERGNPLPF